MAENVDEKVESSSNEETKAEQETSQEEQNDIEENKAMGILAYIIFFIPLLAAKESKFATYHANQGLLNFLLIIAVNIVAVVPVIGWIIWPFGSLFVFILAIIGIINASQGKMKPLPIIGKYELIK